MFSPNAYSQGTRGFSLSGCKMCHAKWPYIQLSGLESNPRVLGNVLEHYILTENNILPENLNHWNKPYIVLIEVTSGQSAPRIT